MMSYRQSHSIKPVRAWQKCQTFCNLFAILGIALALLGSSISLVASAEIADPVRNLKELNSPHPETAYKMKGVQVVTADYKLIRHDFIETQAMTNSQIDQWLIDSVGYISSRQTFPNQVNTPIPLEKKSNRIVSQRAYRPFDYGRALVFKVGSGYIDVKGAGSTSPQQESHGNGLATTYEALREFIFEKKVQQVFTDAKLSNHTVGGYAVLDYGFNIIHNDGSQSPAGAILRQAHTRFSEEAIREKGNSFLDPRQSLRIEMKLRHYGITSSGEGYWRMWGPKLVRDVINIQGNEKGEIVDFGPYRVRSRFYLDLYHYSDVENKNAWPLMEHDDQGFVQPNLKIALSEQEWGRPLESHLDLKEEGLSLDIKALVQQWKKGKASRQTIQDFVQMKLGEGNYPAARQYRLKIPVRCERVLLSAGK